MTLQGVRAACGGCGQWRQSPGDLCQAMPCSAKTTSGRRPARALGFPPGARPRTLLSPSRKQACSAHTVCNHARCLQTFAKQAAVQAPRRNEGSTCAPARRYRPGVTLPALDAKRRSR